jgi:hypothetical protein
MGKTFNEIAQSAVTKWEEKNGSIKDFVKSSTEFKKLFDSSYQGPRPDFKELMTSNDFGILFQKVVNDSLSMPVEPEYLGIKLFTRTINLDTATAVRFPIMGAVTATDVPNNRPVPEQDIAMTQQTLTVDDLISAVAFAMGCFFDVAGGLCVWECSFCGVVSGRGCGCSGCL